MTLKQITDNHSQKITELREAASKGLISTENAVKACNDRLRQTVEEMRAAGLTGSQEEIVRELDDICDIMERKILDI